MVKNDMASAEAARVGEELRDARLALGITLDEVSDRLRINRRYLAALEEGRSRDLPGPAYALGFVRTYARSLGLNADDLARRYRDGPASPRGRTDLVFPEPVTQRGMPAGVVMLIGAIVLVGGYAAWWSWSGSADRVVDNIPPPPARVEQAAREAVSSLSPTGADTAPVLPPTLGQAVPGGRPGVTPPAPGAAPGSPGNVMIGQARPPAAAPQAGPGTAGTPGPAAVTPAAPAPPPVTPAAPAPDASRVTLRATDEAWVQVRDSRSGQVLLNRVLRAGEAFQVPGGREGLVFSTGKAQGLEVVVDGQATQVLAGRQGVVRDVAVNPDTLRAARPPQAAGPGTATATPGPAPR
ncbi:helix-turn-helix domain-containing protein [Roseomonas sp. CCTCC AB2023176]|uniref:helix-turn-helix domain-containing protein n=1 Tax=Roseomonas sp. CCTCC AB2023176 TaxID=3342640 RepID=UPI0035DB0A5C